MKRFILSYIYEILFSIFNIVLNTIFKYNLWHDFNEKTPIQIAYQKQNKYIINLLRQDKRINTNNHVV